MKKFTAIIFVGVIMIFMCLACLGISMRASDKIEETAKSNNVNNTDINFETLYPFLENAKTRPAKKRHFIDYVKEKAEKYTSVALAGSNALIRAAKNYEELIRWNITIQGYNPVIKLRDGYLSGVWVNRDTSESVEAVKGLDTFCKGLGIEYAYINIPTKICVSEDRGISGIIDHSNQNTDRFLDEIGNAGVKYYDFRKILHADGMNHHEAFFRTDHHWKPETGLWAAKHILRFLRDDYGWSVDPEILNPDRFEFKVYPEWFLGSQGKKVTLARTKPEDFTMIYPKFRTLIRFQLPASRMDTSGDFSVTYNMKQVATKDYYGLNPYSAYKYADHPLCIIHNLLNHDGKKILFINESMSDVVIPFVALGIEEIHSIDRRNFYGSIRGYIQAFMPDIVITAYASGLPGATMYDEFPRNKYYDLR